MNQESPLLADLNDKQRDAVLATEGPVLVIAGAGSGKTRALTHRIAYLIQEKHVRPFSVLAVTFTNKAAGEMRERVARLLNIPESSGAAPSLFQDAATDEFSRPAGAEIQNTSDQETTAVQDTPLIGTFHSVCVKILRRNIHLLDFEKTFAIYDTSDQLVLMKHVFEELGIGEKEMIPKAVLNQISNAKNRLMSPTEYERMASSYFEEKTARIYHRYQERLKKNNALDFDDILMKTVELFKKEPSVLAQYQERFRYIHVDEYQDTNHAQYLLIKMLAEKYRNICVVGDHDQAIYGWRGATVQNILDFERDYPTCTVITMEQNYRSTQPILDAAHAVISKNRQRKEKKLWTDRAEGKTVKLFIAENERHEGELIATTIRTAMKGHEFPDYRDFVVLYRTNAQSRALEEVFMRFGIPYKIVGGIRFYERKEIKDMLAYLRLISNPADTVSLLRVINTPQRGIGPKTLEILQNFSNIHDCTFFEAMVRAEEIGEELPEKKREKIAAFAKLIRRLQKRNTELPASGMVKFVLDESGYKKFLDDGTIEGESRLENTAELISVASKYDRLEPGISLSIFLEEVSLITDLDRVDSQDNSVTFMTLHSAKGLEFPTVFIAGLEDGLLPHGRSIFEPQELEEERRLFYVGCTRAMDTLYLLHTKNRMLYGNTQDVIPSQFLGDIPEALLERSDRDTTRAARPLTEFGRKPIPSEKPLQEFSDGDRVNHPQFGEGMVVSVAGGVVTVAFKNPNFGIKKLAISIAPLEKI